MPDIRGRCKQDLERAAVACSRINERLGWIMDEYKDYPEFSDGIRNTIEGAAQLKGLIQLLRRSIP